MRSRLKLEALRIEHVFPLIKEAMLIELTYDPREMLGERMQPIKFGFAKAAEHMTDAGDYICVFPDFIDVLVHRTGTFLIWKFYDNPKIHKVACDNVLQALAIIYDLLKTHDRLEFLPVVADTEDVG